MQLIYQTLLQQIVDEAMCQKDILGILLIGSVARGDALPGADLDLRFIVAHGNSRKAEPEVRQGILIERGYADMAHAQSKLVTNPMKIYNYLDGQILFDPQYLLTRLKEQAIQRFETYQYTKQEREGIGCWLKSAQLKMNVALGANDILKAAFVATTTSWEILVGLWAVNNKPMPPNSSVWFHLKDLSKVPPELDAMLKCLFCGETLARVHAAINLIDWMLPYLGTYEEMERNHSSN